MVGEEDGGAQVESLGGFAYRPMRQSKGVSFRADDEEAAAAAEIRSNAAPTTTATSAATATATAAAAPTATTTTAAAGADETIVKPRAKAKLSFADTESDEDGAEKAKPRSSKKLSFGDVALGTTTSKRPSKKLSFGDDDTKEKKEESSLLPNLFNIQLVYTLMAAQHFGQSNSLRSKAWKCLLRTMVALTSVSLVMCIVMLGIYVYLRPVIPDIELVNVHLSSLAVEEVDNDVRLIQQEKGEYYGYLCTYDFEVIYRVQNWNRRVDFKVEYFEAKLLFGGFDIGGTRMSNFWNYRMTNVTVKDELIRERVKMPLDTGYNLVNSLYNINSLIFVVDLTLRGRLTTVNGILSPPFYVRSRCESDVITTGSGPPPVCLKMNGGA